MKKASLQPLVTIALLTRNSQKHLRQILEAIKNQSYKKYEILVIDSSSEDKTVPIAKEFDCRIVSISPSEFGHGKTRNYAGKLAKGDIVAFLTHDSVPQTKQWLQEMVAPFVDPKVVGVYGRQIPRPDEKALDSFFQASLYRDKHIVWKDGNWAQGDNLFSDANSAVRKSVFLKHPYDNDIIVSEDYEWAIRMLKTGYHIIYNPLASVIHSHSYNLISLFKRNFDVGVSYRKIYKTTDRKSFLLKGLALCRNEITGLRVNNKPYLIPLALLRDSIRYVAIETGKREQLFSSTIKRNYLSAQRWYWK